MGQPQPAFPEHPFRETPLTTHWNPQLDLFLEPPPLRPAAGGPLWRAEWQRQEQRLSRNARSDLLRGAARLADRLRPPPDLRPVDKCYDWEWPSFTSLAVDVAYARAPSPFFSLTGLQAGEQQEALAELFSEIVQHIAFGLSRPCPVYETAQQRRVEFLGCIAWVVHRTQRNVLNLEVRDRDGHWQQAVAGFDVDHALGDGLWLQQVLLPWLPHIEALFGPGAEEAHRRLLEKLTLRFRQPGCVEATERQVRHCLLTSKPLERVLRTLQRHRRPRVPTSFLYSQLSIRADFWINLQHRSPGLVLFAYLAMSCKVLRGKLVSAGGDIGALRSHCFDRGMTPAGWRFLCRFGAWAFEGMLDPDPTAEVSLENLIAWVQWQAEAGLQQPLPAAYAETVLASGAMSWHPDQYAVVVVDPRLARIAEAHAPGPQGEGREPIDIDEWEDVLEWWAETQPEPDRNQWQSGWPAIRRLHQRWFTQAMSEPWDCPLEPATLDGWRVRPLVCGRDLFAEAERMRHCAASYLHKCLEGSQRFFTVEEPNSGKPVATFNLELRDGRWEVGDVRGKCNARPEPGMWMLATVTRNSYNRNASPDP